MTITPTNVQNIRRDSIMPEEINNYDQNIQIPIVGYEVMEERARFTVKQNGPRCVFISLYVSLILVGVQTQSGK